MKRILFVVGIVLTMSCCNTNDDKHLLDRIEELWSLSEECVSSACAQTVVFRDSIDGASERVRMNYDLLNIRLRDKLYIIPSSDDSVRQVTKYFDKHGNSRERMRAYHYMSSVYRDLHDSPRAITNGLKAIEYAKKDDCNDTVLLKHIYSNMTALYRSQLNIDESLRMALEFYQVFPDNVWAIADVASAYSFTNDSLNTKKHFDMLYERCCNDSLFFIHPGHHAELLHYYTNIGVNEKAKKIYGLLRSLPEEQYPDNYGIAMGYYCRKYVGLDSALVYLLHDYNRPPSKTVRCDVASLIMECYLDKSDYVNASLFGQKFRDANDSVIAERQFEQTRNAHAEYKYIRNREEEARILQHDAMMERWLYIGIIVFLVSICMGYYLHINRRRSLEGLLFLKNKRIDDLRKEVSASESSLTAMNEKLHNSISALDDKSTELADTIQMLADKQHELTVMKEALSKTQMEIAEYEEKLMEESAKNRNLQSAMDGKAKLNKELIKEYISREMMEMNTDLLELFDKSLSMKICLSDAQWKGFLSNIDAKHPTFKNQLEERVPRLNLALMRTAYLMMAGLTNQQIESIMGVSRQTQWERAKKLEKYIGDILPYRKFQ